MHRAINEKLDSKGQRKWDTMRKMPENIWGKRKRQMVLFDLSKQ